MLPKEDGDTVRKDKLTAAALLLLMTLSIAGVSCGNSSTEKESAAGGRDLIRSIADTDHFQAAIRNGRGRLLVFDFYADWCRPCKQLTPILKKLAQKYGDRVDFFKVDVDRNRNLAESMGLQGIPHVLFVKDGATVHSLTGLHPKDTYLRVIERYAKADAADAGADTPDGDIVDGVRVIRRSTQAALDTLYVYRGETVKLVIEDIGFPYAIHIPAYGISQDAVVGQDLTVTFKAKKIGVFPVFCNGDCPTGDGAQYGRIVVMPFESSGHAAYTELSAEKARDMIRTADPLILDVRTPAEYYNGHLEGAKLIPVQQLAARLSELRDHKDRDVLLYCRSGNRSTVAAEILIRDGFQRLFNLRHGIIEWTGKGYGVVK